MVSAVILLFVLINAEDKVERFLKSIVVWTLFCYLVTEVLSIFQAVGTLSLWLCWLAFDMMLLFINVVRKKKLIANIALKRRFFPRITKKRIGWISLAAVMVLLALKTTPYNWDSMTYHMPRVFHWLQNGTVAFYATHNDRQVVNPVLGAFVNLHVYAMAGGKDSFSNLIQCISFLTNGVLVYYIAKKLHSSEKCCLLASFIFYSMPIAFAEALTTQVDNYSAFWMLAFVYLILDLLNIQQRIVLDKKSLFHISCLSLCIAFGYLAKPSVGIGMAVFAIWLLVVVVKRKDSFAAILVYLLMSAAILAAILAPGFIRNINAFHALSAPGTGQRQLIGSLHPKHILVNFLKNLTFNMPTVWIYNSSQLIWTFVTRFSGLLDIDINNPVISEDGRGFQVHSPQDYGHDTAVNPIIIWLLAACMVFFVVKNRKKYSGEIRNQFFIVSSVAFLVFCAVLRWEPFVSRYMISYFAVLCPALGGQIDMAFHGCGNRLRRKEIGFMAIVCFLCATEFMGLAIYHGGIAASQRGRYGYFVNRKEIEDGYLEMVDIINDKGYQNIGLYMGGDSYEYPLEALLDHHAEIEHVNVANGTSIYEDPEFTPDVIVALDQVISGTLICHGNKYVVTDAFDGGYYLLEKIR